MKPLAYLILGACLSHAQPYLPAAAAVNEASLAASGLPSGSIARGSRFLLNGANLGPAVAAEQTTFPLATTLAGVTVSVTSAGVTRACWPVSVQASQVRAILPSAVPAGPATLRVTVNGVPSNTTSITVANNSPGIYTVDGSGYGPGRIYNYASPTALFSSLAKPARRNLTASLYGTGFGASSNPDDVAPPQQNLPYTVEVRVAGIVSTILFAGRSTTLPGQDQVVFRVPATAPFGCYVPVQVSVNGVPSNVVTIAVSNLGEACADAANPLSTKMRTGGKVAVASLTRKDVTDTPLGTVTVDRGRVIPRTLGANDYGFFPSLSPPPAGSCTAYMGRGDVIQTLDPLQAGGSFLNVGTVTAADASNNTRTIAADPPRGYQSVLGQANSSEGSSAGPPFLNPGTFSVAGTGFGAIGSFLSSTLLGPSPNWTNSASITTVSRAGGITVQWSGAGTRQVFVAGYAYDPVADASAAFFCAASPGATSLTVPPNILRLLPAVSSNTGATRGLLGVGALADNAPAPFAASGLDLGLLVLYNSVSKPVLYQ